jgi:hypothetical protein
VRTRVWSRATASASTAWGSVLLVSVLVGLATIGGLILFIIFIIPGIYIGVRLAVSVEALVVEGRRGTQAIGRSWELVGGHWWHAFGALVVAGLLTGVVNAVITTPFNNTSWFVQAVAAAVATVITMPYGVLVGVLLYLDLRARKEQLNLERLRTDLQASAPDLQEPPRRNVIDGSHIPPDARGSHEPARTGRPPRWRRQSVSARTTTPSRGRRSLPVFIVPVMTASSSGDQNAKAPQTPWWPITCAAGNR